MVTWNSSSKISKSKGLSLSSCRYREVVLQKPCSDKPMYFCLMNRAFTTHLAASKRSVKGTWGEKTQMEGEVKRFAQVGGAFFSRPTPHFSSPEMVTLWYSLSGTTSLSCRSGAWLCSFMYLMVNRHDLDNLEPTIVTVCCLKAKVNAHSRSVALSIFKNSCLARRRMSGSNLRAERLRSTFQ